MSKTVWMLLSTLCLFAVAPLRADDTRAARPWSLSVGAFLPTDLPSGMSADAGFSVAAGGTIRQNDDGRWVGSLRYSRYHLKSGGDIELINPTIEYQWQFGADRRLYVGPLVGTIFGQNTEGGHSSSLSYGVAAGYDFMPWFLEARYVRGTKDGEHGAILSLGLRF